MIVTAFHSLAFRSRHIQSRTASSMRHNCATLHLRSAFLFENLETSPNPKNPLQNRRFRASYADTTRKVMKFEAKRVDRDTDAVGRLEKDKPHGLSVFSDDAAQREDERCVTRGVDLKTV
jgi:hypothetical protein